MASYTWNGASGDWVTNPGDWQPSGPPAQGDTANITAAGSYTLSISASDVANAGTVNLDASGATIALFGTLNVGAGIGGEGIAGNVGGTLTLTAGTFDLASTGSPPNVSPGKLRFATVVANGASVEFNGGVLADVIWQGPFELTAASATVRIAVQGGNPTSSEGAAQGLEVTQAGGSLPGTIDLTGVGADAIFLDYQTFSHAQINIGSAATSEASAALSVSQSSNNTSGIASVTIDSTTTLVSAGANLNAAIGSPANSDTLVNNGLISAAASGGAFAIKGGVVFNNAGTVSVTNGDTMTVMSNGATTLTNAVGGTVTIDAASELVLQGTMSDQGGLFTNAGTFDITSTGELDAYGTITGGMTVDGRVDDLLATPGMNTLDITGSLSGNSGIIAVLAGQTVEVGGSVNLPNVTFSSGAPGEVFGFGSLQNSATVHTFSQGDTIWFTNLTDTGGNVTAAFAGTTLSIVQNSTTIAALTLAGPTDYATGTFSAVADGNGGTDITFACFVTGTRIATPDGMVRVERLRAGERVSLARGGSAEIVWIGRRRVDCAAHPQPAQVHPLRIRPHAFGPNMPARALKLSPEHAVYLDGVLVPVGALENGATIVREPVAQVTYWHIELAAHDVLLAEGVPAESWLDTGNRAMFENAPLVVSAPTPAPCAPVVESGPLFEAIRRRIAERAAALGLKCRPSRDVLIDDCGRRGVLLPAGVSRVRLVSAVGHRPADRRRLGVLVSEIRLDGEVVGPDAYARGFHAPEQHGARTMRWTNGAATLALPQARHGRVLDLDVQALAV